MGRAQAVRIHLSYDAEILERCVLEAVFFDLYETLITEFDPHWKPMPSTAERLGVDQRTFRSAWTEAQDARFTGAFPDYPSALRFVCDVIGEQPDESILQELVQEKVVLKARPFLDIEDTILDMLRSLRAAGLKVGLISNCSPGEVAAWEECALAPLFDRAVFSYEAGCMKPSSDIYHIGCRELDVEPAHAAFVGDGGSDELAGAAGAGLRPYWASWFIDRWPEWRRKQDVYVQAREWPRLKSPAEVVDLVRVG